MPAKTTANPASSPVATARRGLVLASTSRYRKMLLERLGIPFVAVAPGTDETPLADEAPAARLSGSRKRKPERQ
jgi:septum formation protein